MAGGDGFNGKKILQRNEEWNARDGGWYFRVIL